MWHGMLAPMLLSGHRALVRHPPANLPRKIRHEAVRPHSSKPPMPIQYGSRLQKPLVRLKIPNNSAKIFVKIPPFCFLG